MRIDKWLWFARALKTRTLAATAVSEGRIRLNGGRIDAPSRVVRVGDVVTASLPERVLVWKILAEGDRRGPASEARLLYEDLAPPERPAAPTLDPAGAREPGAGRPTKQERRAID
ncbi:MAG: RNA-binding S4 domain-containing protein, partial [Beijerinckiaceae bacterium]